MYPPREPPVVHFGQRSLSSEQEGSSAALLKEPTQLPSLESVTPSMRAPRIGRTIALVSSDEVKMGMFTSDRPTVRNVSPSSWIFASRGETFVPLSSKLAKQNP